MRVVISQPMYFPWVGFLEQLRLADVLVVYDDVQFSKGSFANRVQAKTGNGSRWLTVPLRELRLGQRIVDVQIDEQKDWRTSHRGTLHQAYSKAPFFQEMMKLFDDVVQAPVTSVGELSFRTTRALMCHFALNPSLRILHSADMKITGGGSQRVLDIVREVEGTEYITGHGARGYLDHAAFEKAGVMVSYMHYRCLPYPQLHGPFTPYVSSLDLIANCGAAGSQYIQPRTVPWRDFTNESQ